MFFTSLKISTISGMNSALEPLVPYICCTVVGVDGTPPGSGSIAGGLLSGRGSGVGVVSVPNRCDMSTQYAVMLASCSSISVSRPRAASEGTAGRGLPDETRLDRFERLDYSQGDGSFKQRGDQEQRQGYANDGVRHRHARDQQLRQRQYGAHHHGKRAAGEDGGFPPRRAAPQVIGQIAGQNSEDRHVDEVGPERQDSAILKHQRLDGND